MDVESLCSQDQARFPTSPFGVVPIPSEPKFLTIILIRQHPGKYVVGDPLVVPSSRIPAIRNFIGVEFKILRAKFMSLSTDQTAKATEERFSLIGVLPIRPHEAYVMINRDTLLEADDEV